MIFNILQFIECNIVGRRCHKKNVTKKMRELINVWGSLKLKPCALNFRVKKIR